MSARRSVTLVEVIFVLVTAAIVIGTTTGAIAIMTRGSGTVAQAADTRRLAAVTMNRMRRELAMAITVTELSSTAMTFTHPDMDGDASDEAIRYSWGGTPGDALTRKLNSGAAQNVVPDCRAFALSIAADAVADEDGDPTETEEMVLGAHDEYPEEYTWWTEESSLSSWNREAAYFVPDYPDATSVTITRVKASLRRVTSFPIGSVRISIREAQPGTHDPADESIAERTITAGNIETYYLWHEVSFGEDVAKRPPGVGYTVVLRGSRSSAETCMEYHKLTAGSYDDGFEGRYSTDGGVTWMPHYENLTWDGRIYVFGTFTVPGGDGTADSGLLRTVYIHLEVDDGDTEAVLHGAVRCVNRPDLTGLSYDALPLLPAS